MGVQLCSQVTSDRQQEMPQVASREVYTGCQENFSTERVVKLEKAAQVELTSLEVLKKPHLDVALEDMV